jgi:hypothetical protein
MSILTLYRYLNRSSKVKPLSHELTTPYDPLKVDWDDLLVMMTARAKDPDAAKKLKVRYNADTAVTLIPKLPPRRKPTLRSRMRTWLQRMDGSYATDPYKMELRRARRKRFINTGYSETRLAFTIRMKSK